MANTAKIKIMIVDDLQRVRQSLKMYLEMIEDFKIVCEAENGLQAIEFAKALKPDIVLMDLKMPILNGTDTSFYLKKNHLVGGVIILSIYDDIKNRKEAEKAGADTFLVKGISMTELSQTIRNVWSKIQINNPSSTIGDIKK